jgi:hypothetical protein
MAPLLNERPHFVGTGQSIQRDKRSLQQVYDARSARCSPFWNTRIMPQDGFRIFLSAAHKSISEDGRQPPQ